MTETQVYLVMGVPTLAVLVEMLVNARLFAAVNVRLTRMEDRWK